MRLVRAMAAKGLANRQPGDAAQHYEHGPRRARGPPASCSAIKATFRSGIQRYTPITFWPEYP